MARPSCVLLLTLCFGCSSVSRIASRPVLLDVLSGTFAHLMSWFRANSVTSLIPEQWSLHGMLERFFCSQMWNEEDEASVNQPWLSTILPAFFFVSFRLNHSAVSTANQLATSNPALSIVIAQSNLTSCPLRMHPWISSLVFFLVSCLPTYNTTADIYSLCFLATGPNHLSLDSLALSSIHQT